MGRETLSKRNDCQNSAGDVAACRAVYENPAAEVAGLVGFAP